LGGHLGREMQRKWWTNRLNCYHNWCMPSYSMWTSDDGLRADQHQKYIISALNLDSNQRALTVQSRLVVYRSWQSWSTAVWFGNNWYHGNAWRVAWKLWRRSLDKDVYRNTAATDRHGTRSISVVHSARVLAQQLHSGSVYTLTASGYRQ